MLASLERTKRERSLFYGKNSAPGKCWDSSLGGNTKFGNYIADFYCHQAQLVVECDGPVHETNESWQHDQLRDAYMVGQGLRVLRFSNEEVLESIEAVVRKIAEYCISSCINPT